MKANITVKDFGTKYQLGEKIYFLTDFKPEPQVEMTDYTDSGLKVKGNLSDFKDYVRLIPETTRKVRKDKGIPKKKS